jgi:hypothetical protein
VYRGLPVYTSFTRDLLTQLFSFVGKYRETFGLGMFRAEHLTKAWRVLALLQMDHGWQRVHIESPTCEKCGRRGAIANPTEPSLYFGAPDDRLALKRAWELPRLGCPRCAAPLQGLTRRHRESDGTEPTGLC